MSIRRILVEKPVLILGKWDVNRVNDDVVRLIDLDSREKKGKKIRLQLTTEGLQIARGMFQDSFPDDFTPISAILNIVIGRYSPQNVMCFTRGQTTAYSVVVYTCGSDYDCVEFVDNYRRLRRSVTTDGEKFDLRPIDDNNWSLVPPPPQQPQGTLLVTKNKRVPVGHGKVIVAPPPSYEPVSSGRQSKVMVQNGSFQNHGNHSDSGIVTNGTSSSEKSRTKVKRAKSFKLFDSLKSSSKTEKNSKREKREKGEKAPQVVEKHTENFNDVNGFSNQPAIGEQEIKAELRENLQEVSEKLQNIKLLLEKNNSETAVEEPVERNNQKHGKVVSSHKHSSQSASDSEAKPTARMRLTNDKGRFQTGSVGRTQTHRNGEMKIPEYRVSVGYPGPATVRVSHVHPSNTHHRTRNFSNSIDSRSIPHHSAESHPGNSISASMTLPRTYKMDSASGPGTKHTPRVTFDESTTDTTSRRNSTRSAGRVVNHGPRGLDTVVKPIEKVYGNQTLYYNQPRTVFIGPGGRQGSSSAHVNRYSSHEREFVQDDL